MSVDLTKEADELRQSFYALETPRDVARLLVVGYDRLIYHLHKTTPTTRYQTFKIPKRSGGSREISAPVTGLKIIQRKLNQVLQAVYLTRPQVHGFVLGKSILTNAEKHSQKRLILKIDLQDFFPSINFGRTRGVLMAHPYNRNPAVATILAQICCFDNKLPQGAPTSPVISNMVCAKMDAQLLRLAKKYSCTYTRYADDLTFSTTRRKFTPAICTLAPRTKEVTLGEELQGIITSNTFQVNTKKLRLLPSHSRQIVTGLITTKFPNVTREYISQIRAMLHAWETHGLPSAEQHFHERHYQKYRAPTTKLPSFTRVLEGKIAFLGHVRGPANHAYLKFRDQLHKLAPHLKKGLEPKVHWLPFKQIDRCQLTLELEDNLGIRLLPDTQSYEVDGHLQIHTKAVSIKLCAEDKIISDGSRKLCRKVLTPEEEELLTRTYAAHHLLEPTFQGEMAPIVTRYAPSVAKVVVTTKAEGIEKAATGFIISRRNLLMTAAHVVDPEELEIKYVEFDKVQVRCKILDYVPSLDVALLELEHEVADVWPIRIRQLLRMPEDRGMHCVTVGFPDEPGYFRRSVPMELSITGLGKNYVTKQEILTLSQTLGSGTSGSPILSKNHSLVGMVIGFPSAPSSNQEGDKPDKGKPKQQWSAAAVSCNDLAPIIQKHET